jgi:hypothetical protein
MGSPTDGPDQPDLTRSPTWSLAGRVRNHPGTTSRTPSAVIHRSVGGPLPNGDPRPH